MTILMERVERWCWYAFLVTAPWQTRLIVWQSDAAFNEWRSAFLYLSDLLMLGMFCCALVAVRGRIRARLHAGDALLGLFFAAAVLSLTGATDTGVGIAALVRLAQFMLLYVYLRYRAWHRFDADASAVAFVIGAVCQGMLGIAQYVLQHDAGLRWLGETVLRTDMRGVAVFYDLTQTKILRAYGTLPHPNVLAAYLAFALPVVVWLWVRHGMRTRRDMALWQAVFSVLLVALLLTFARTVIAAWVCAWAVLGVLVLCRRCSHAVPNIGEVRRRLRTVLITGLVVSAGVFMLLWPQMVARLTIASSDEAVQQRVQYNADALATGGGRSLHVNWTGVGIGNFTTWLARFDPSLPPYAVQPAHNVFLLAYSEMGAVGLCVWAAWLIAVVSAARAAHQSQPLIRWALLACVSAFILIGSLDHFFWTLQQGRILWWAALALAAGRA